ncbi:hypothetical protein CASFOL_018956 [Castilleja foliolosa]|uniref:Uncharacterized protein n=1 Tax=Castilleja foliolosa TaxID=1961234 RepID=A0ABD3D3U2_9LAMI
MKREGRQRGMVQTFAMAYDRRPSSGRCFNEISAPTTAGLFTKAPSKPTNHSKFTAKCGQSKCRRCHFEPACKSKDKTKGTHKIRTTSSAVGGVNVSGFSAIDVLDYLDDNDC